MTLSFNGKGGWPRFEAYLKRLSDGDIFAILDKYGPIGVNALRSATAVESSETANSWTYTIERRSNGYSIHWRNTHMVGGMPLAIMLQYGHGTGTGGYVEGRDYINPAMRPIFDKMVTDFMREVTR